MEVSNEKKSIYRIMTLFLDTIIESQQQRAAAQYEITRDVLNVFYVYVYHSNAADRMERVYLLFVVQ